MQLCAVISGMALGMMVLIEITDDRVVIMRFMMMSVLVVCVGFVCWRHLRVRHCMRTRNERTRNRQHNTNESYPELAHTAR